MTAFQVHDFLALGKLDGPAAKEILDFSITLPDGTQIRVDPPERNASIQIQFADGKVQSIVYSKS